MKKFIIILSFFTTEQLCAQQFIDAGMIEFEVRINNHKMFGDGIWGEMFKDKMPQFSTKYYSYTFDHNKALYQYERQDEKTKMPFGGGTEEDNKWYSDYDAGRFTNQKFVFDDTYLLSDSLMKIDWRLTPNETRVIAGFNCRKATGIIFDSVYVFAFYTDEIAISGGPMGIHGLPGMIMGITIPRMYTSWIATKLQLNGVNTGSIRPPQKGKKKKASELQETLKKVTSDWGNYGQQAIWNIFL